MNQSENVYQNVPENPEKKSLKYYLKSSSLGMYYYSYY